MLVKSYQPQEVSTMEQAAAVPMVVHCTLHLPGHTGSRWEEHGSEISWKQKKAESLVKLWWGMASGEGSELLIL